MKNSYLELRDGMCDLALIMASLPIHSAPTALVVYGFVKQLEQSLAKACLA